MLGNTLKKKVILTPENDQERPILTFNLKDRRIVYSPTYLSLP